MRLTIIISVVVAAVVSGAPSLVFDFEHDLQGWRVVEGEFGAFRCSRAEYHHHGGAYKKHGTWFLSTLETSAGRPEDGFVGVAESPVFRLAGPRMTLMVGGGNHPNTYVALCRLDGTEVRRAQGRRSQEMVDVAWELADGVGKAFFLRVADGHRGGWGHVTVDFFRAEAAIDAALSSRHFSDRKPMLGTLLKTPPPAAKPLPSPGTVQSLRRAVSFLQAAYGSAYPHAEDYLSRLVVLERDLDSAAEASARRIAGKALESLRRKALVSNPMVSGTPILFVVRHQYKPDHHNTATMFQAGTVNAGKYQGGGALKIIDFADSEKGRVTTLLDAGPTGVVRDPDIHFSGRKIVFSMRRGPTDDYHIYEVGVDGQGLRQLTSAAGVSDIDPMYLPDDSIVFTSTREPKFCMCNCHIMGNLFRMNADGGNIHQIGKSTLHEGHAALMPDGRILYDRWEYVDRNFGDAQGLWTTNPDGTNHAVYWGNNTKSPGGVLDARIIPGSQRVLCVFGSCHDRPWGALAVVDRRLGIDGRRAVMRTWPRTALELVGKGNYDTFKKVWPRYEDPYPLASPHQRTAARSAHGALFLLCSRMTGKGEQMGLVLADTFGNEVMLHTEPPGCYDPMPLAPGPRPGQIPARTDLSADQGVLYVSDVYQGTHMAGVERGDVRFLRVVESPEKRFWTGPAWGGQGVHKPAMNWHSFENKRILGTVPVHADGSASVAIPADTFVYFQLLDRDGMMIQSMRSGTIVRPGEVTGCAGCHEPRQAAPAAVSSPGSRVPQAVSAPPAVLTGWYGSPRRFSFIDDVQPVFDRHCVGCHDFGKRAGKALNLAGDRSETFNVAYNELWRRKMIDAIGAGPAAVQPAKSWGSRKSRLISVLRGDHHDVDLSPEEFDRLVTWIDINAPYYPTYASAFPENLAGRCPLDAGQLSTLARLTGVPFPKLARHQTNRGPQISFDRPDRSPCLAHISAENRDAYRDALAIIKAGTEALAQRRRGDSLLQGIDMCDTDQRRNHFYRTRQQAGKETLRAMQAGHVVYDKTSPDDP